MNFFLRQIYISFKETMKETAGSLKKEKRKKKGKQNYYSTKNTSTNTLMQSNVFKINRHLLKHAKQNELVSSFK